MPRPPSLPLCAPRFRSAPSVVSGRPGFTTRVRRDVDLLRLLGQHIAKIVSCSLMARVCVEVLQPDTYGCVGGCAQISLNFCTELV